MMKYLELENLLFPNIMKNRVNLFSKKISLICIFVLNIVIPVFSFSNFWWNISLNFEGKTGSTDELVFENNKKISLLEWETPFLPAISFRNQLGLSNFVFDIFYSSAIPVKMGTMCDYDYILGTSNNISNFSKHELFVDKDFSVGTNFGWKSLCFEKIFFIPNIGFSYTNKKFSAQNGYLQYPQNGNSWTGNEDKENLLGTVISYEQSIWTISVGMKFGLKITEDFQFGLETKYYPYVHIDSIDSHFLRQVQFYDSMKKGCGGKLIFDINAFPFQTNKELGLKISCIYEKISCRGLSYFANIGLSSSSFTKLDNVVSGLDSEYFSISVGIIFTLT